MWASGRLEFKDELRVGEPIRLSSEILKVAEKEGKAGRMVFVTVRHAVEFAARAGRGRGAGHRLRGHARGVHPTRPGGGTGRSRLGGAGGGRPGAAVPLLGPDLQRPPHPLRPALCHRYGEIPGAGRARPVAGAAADAVGPAPQSRAGARRGSAFAACGRCSISRPCRCRAGRAPMAGTICAPSTATGMSPCRPPSTGATRDRAAGAVGPAGPGLQLGHDPEDRGLGCRRGLHRPRGRGGPRAEGGQPRQCRARLHRARFRRQAQAVPDERPGHGLGLWRPDRDRRGGRPAGRPRRGAQGERAGGHPLRRHAPGPDREPSWAAPADRDRGPDRDRGSVASTCARSRRPRRGWRASSTARATMPRRWACRWPRSASSTTTTPSIRAIAGTR